MTNTEKELQGLESKLNTNGFLNAMKRFGMKLVPATESSFWVKNNEFNGESLPVFVFACHSSESRDSILSKVYLRSGDLSYVHELNRPMKEIVKQGIEKLIHEHIDQSIQLRKDSLHHYKSAYTLNEILNRINEEMKEEIYD